MSNICFIRKCTCLYVPMVYGRSKRLCIHTCFSVASHTSFVETQVNLISESFLALKLVKNRIVYLQVLFQIFHLYPCLFPLLTSHNHSKGMKKWRKQQDLKAVQQSLCSWPQIMLCTSSNYPPPSHIWLPFLKLGHWLSSMTMSLLLSFTSWRKLFLVDWGDLVF